MPQQTILIAGPTASGKSALALRLAEQVNGVIINADSMQVYRELRLLTARPSPAEEARIPHRLYGVRSMADPCSVGQWLELALTEIEAAWTAGQVPILVGGTGLYFTALTEGLAPVPDVPASIRARYRGRLQTEGSAPLIAELRTRDPEMAARLQAADPQRVVRALEVLEATGQSLAYWQEQTGSGLRLRHPWLGVVLELPRPLLYRRCDQRFLKMLDAGVLDEVAMVDACGFDRDLASMKALGLPELISHLHGELSREEAVQAAQQATRRYAKRQMTWFKNKMITWNRVFEQDSESFFDRIMPIVSWFLLTP